VSDGWDGARLIFVYFASYALFTPKIDLNLLSNDLPGRSNRG